VSDEFNDAGDNVEVIGMCVQLEAEAAAIEDPAERAEMLEGFGLGEGALFRMVRSAYHLLGLRTFLTTGEKESRAWTFYAGSTAPECAGRIHTDFQRGFIKAEVIHWDELLDIGSWQGVPTAKEHSSRASAAGKIRVEGKDYHPLDGDVDGVPLQRVAQAGQHDAIVTDELVPRPACARRAGHRSRQAGPDEILDHRTCVARRDACSSGKLPSRDRLFQPCERLQERATNGWSHIENRCAEVHRAKRTEP
jgi:hypothetical protein